MARILVHALAATAGGGANYLRNFLGRLGELGASHQWLAMVPSDGEFASPAPNVRLLPHKSGRGAFRRVYYDQIALRRLIKEESVDLILATGNFGMLRPPVPQVLLNRNALYFSREHLWELRRRGEFRELLNTLMRRRLALASIADSVCNVVPTHAFASDIRDSLSNIPEDRFYVVPHGFDHAAFRGRSASAEKPAAGVKRILMVSHYNYFRNFETLIRAVAELRRTSPTPVELVLTTKLGKGVKDHRYDTSEAGALVDTLGLGDCVRMLGTVPHSELEALYRSADVAVCPSYAESFGHPMVEAMAMGVPLVASDRKLQREICGEAAVYFSTFDPSDLAKRLQDVLFNAELSSKLSAAGPPKAAVYSWERHFRELLNVLDAALGRRRAAA
jgi:glycosyltransferase involved in cell wall biosynthesis